MCATRSPATLWVLETGPDLGWQNKVYRRDLKGDEMGLSMGWVKSYQSSMISAQKKGVEVRDMWHKANWTQVRLNSGSIKLPREDWLLKHDCERFMPSMYRRALAELGGGDKIPITSLAASRESDEFLVEMPPTPVGTPKREVDDPMNGHR
ncbi:unnamed protein product [Tuber aestivum]|uniref:Uncharacterized protein n=1 Tax=Tuber aestivum TaxID=59557 RepID=A0A292Q051_9PEZI|nr:unnamed protein product [Tuber aestivum]